jgi:hypothetical protein
MKFQVGDKVIVQHSNEEGEVIDIINDKMVMVEVKGVRFPAYSDQIDFPYFKRFSEQMSQKAAAPKVKKTIENLKPEPSGTPRLTNQTAAGVWLAFLPVFDKDVFDDDVVDYFKVYLVNQTALELNFSYWLRLGGATELELTSNIHAFSDFYIQNVPLDNLNDKARFDFDFSLAIPRPGKVEHFEASHKIKAKQLFQKIEGLRQHQEATFSYLLFDVYPDAPFKESLDLSRLSNAGFKIYDASRARQHLEPARSVIDLHIEKLTDQWKRMTPAEMLGLQISTFEKYYELSVVHHQPSLTVIHGVGTGRLREEIHEILHTKKEVKSFVNQYLPSYGYGATEIYFT